MPPAKEPDVVVVGAGAGGLALAWRLVTEGLTVTLLEAGGSYQPHRDYPQRDPDFELRAFPYDARRDVDGKPRYSFGTAQAIDPALAGYRSRDPQRGRSTDAKRRYVAYSHVQGVGGSTLHFQAEAHRLHPDALQLESRVGVGHDWPFAYAELERYYDIAEAQIGIAAPFPNPWRPQAQTPQLPAHPLSYASRRLRRPFAAVGAKLLPNSLAILSRPFRGRRRCNYCNSCTAGCPIGDKGSADVTFLPPALATRRLDLRTECRTLRVETDGQGRAAAIVYADRLGKRQRIAAPYVVLAAGAIETPRLLLLSESNRFPRGLANGSGQVGRNFCESLSWISVGLHPDRLDSFRGVPMDGSAWDFSVPGTSKGGPTGFRLATAHGAAGLRGPLTYASHLLPGYGLEHQRAMARWFGHGIAIAALGEWLPNAQTLVDLDPDERDRFDQPLARIQSFLGPHEKELLVRMADTVRGIWSAIPGAQVLIEHSTLDHFEATHVAGTCAMGADPQRTVVDEEGFCHEVPNLALADGSILPSQGGGDSPFLTISALAIRTADRLLRRAGGKKRTKD